MKKRGEGKEKMKNKDLLIYIYGFVESFEFKNIVIGIGIEKRDS